MAVRSYSSETAFHTETAIWINKSRMSSYKYNSGMQSAAQAYNASGYTGSSNNLSGSET